MKLFIEEWAEKNLTDDANKLMEEAVICYKVGAYRASYIMSYLAFKTTIRGRLLSTQKPDYISEERWKYNVIEPIKDDNKWERGLDELVKSSCADGKEEKAVFKFTDYERIKSRYMYWKDIRNSCAHAKNEHISSSTVEQFWNYMQDDISEFYVSGGKEYLLDRFCYLFKYYNTEGEDELKKVLKEISVLYKEETKDFFEKFFWYNRSFIHLNSNNIDFWKVVINSDNEIIRTAFIDFLYDHIDFFIIWYEKFPNLFCLMESRHEIFIQESLSPKIENGNYIQPNIFWSLLVKIIRNDIKKINLDKVTSDWNRFQLIEYINLNEDDMLVLHNNKVFQKFLLNCGKEYFYNILIPIKKICEDLVRYVEICFEYVEWDINIVDKINCSYSEVEKRLLEEASDLKNCNIIKESYNRVIEKYKNEIIDTIKNNGKTLHDYNFIERRLEVNARV